MRKKLVKRDSVEDFISHDEGKLYMDGSLILTPGAKDYLRNKGIAMVYGSKPARSSGELRAKVVSMLESEYGVTDQGEASAICGRVMELLKANQQ